MKPWHCVSEEPRKVTTNLVEPITPIEYIGSTDTDPDEKEIQTVTQQLVLKLQKAWACYERYLKLDREVTEEAFHKKKTDDQQQFLADTLPPPQSLQW